MTPHCQACDAYLDGRLADAEKVAFEAHLPCPTCSAALASWQRTGQLFEAWAAPFAAPASAEQVRRLRMRREKTSASKLTAFGWGVAGLAVVVAITVVGALQVNSRETDWPVHLQVGVTQTSASKLVEFGSSEAAQRVRIGPDAIEVAVAARVELLEKTKRRTRLRLNRGAVTAHVEPGRVGRQFIIESPPYRITVVGTVFEARRESLTLQVLTTRGTVRVERLGTQGEVIDSQLLTEGQSLIWPEPTHALEATETDAGVEASTTSPQPTARGPSSKELLSWRQRAARGGCERVFKETKAALQAMPNHVGIWRVQADCARKLGQPALAVEAYRRVVTLASGAEAAEAMLLAVSLSQDELSSAQMVLELTKSLNTLRGAPGSVAGALHVRRARALLSLGGRAEARQEVDLVLKTFSATPAAAEALRLRSEIEKP